MNAETSPPPKPKKQLYRSPVALEPTPREVADWVKGTLVNAEFAPLKITGFATLDQATASEISFLSGEKHLKTAAESVAGILIAPHGLDLKDRARIEVGNVWKSVANVLTRLYPPPAHEPGIHPTAVIGRDAKIAEGVFIGPYCRIGDGVEIGKGTTLISHVSIDPGCKIGANCRFHPNVSLQGLVIVGNRVILHSGVVLGADGFRYEMGDAGLLKIPQVGAVILEDEVEIGALSAVDRPFLHETRIGWGTKIDNLVQIAHNCIIGKLCVIAACTGIAGSATVGDACLIGGAVSIKEGTTIGNGCKIGACSGVIGDLAAGSVVAGMPARPPREMFRSLALMNKLPDMLKRIQELEREKS